MAGLLTSTERHILGGLILSLVTFVLLQVILLSDSHDRYDLTYRPILLGFCVPSLLPLLKPSFSSNFPIQMGESRWEPTDGVTNQEGDPRNASGLR
jgi:hypothetical protein